MADQRIVFCLVFLVNLSCCHVFNVGQRSLIEDYVSNVVACRGVPGLTLGVVKGEQTWTKGFGFADVQTKRPVTTSTLFSIGSITKSFTATVLAILLEKSDNKFTWNTKLTEILGDRFELDNEIRTKETTIKDILTHRTGLPSGDIAFFAGYPGNFTLTDLIKRLRYLKGTKPFRDSFMYNNIMYGLAGHVIEVLSGNTWSEEIRSKILIPLGMSETEIIGETGTASNPNLAKSYVFVGKERILANPGFNPGNPIQPAAAIASSSEDMVKYIRFILNKGNATDGKTVADWKNLAMLYKPYTTIGMAEWTKATFPISDVDSGYGFGWFISNHQGYKKIWHSGKLSGYESMLWIFPEVEVGIFASVNGPGPGLVSSRTFEVIFSYIFDQLLGNEPWLNKTTSCTFPMPWMAEYTSPDVTDIIDKPVSSPEQFVGSYGHRLFGYVEITWTNNTLSLKTGTMYGDLKPTKQKDMFRLKIFGDQRATLDLLEVMFSRLNDGKYQDVQIVLIVTQRYTYTRGIMFETTTELNTNVASTILGQLMYIVLIAILL